MGETVSALNVAAQAVGPGIVKQRYINLRDAALYLGLSEKTLYEWAAKGRMPLTSSGVSGDSTVRSWTDSFRVRDIKVEVMLARRSSR